MVLHCTWATTLKQFSKSGKTKIKNFTKKAPFLYRDRKYTIAMLLEHLFRKTYAIAM